MSKSWLTMTAADLGRGIDSGAIDPVALTDTYLTAIKGHKFADRIYSVVTEDRARSEAEAAQQRAQNDKRLSPLDGVPISWKDLYDSAGIPTEAGTALLKGRTPNVDADVLQNATSAGLVCLGKTHMSELAFSGLGINPKTQTAPNITDPKAAPGGSSSGAAASVAFGLAAAGIGSDTGGSIRIPSAWNNLYGLKPTHGALPMGGVVPLCARFDTAGPLCRSVEDTALVTAILGGVQQAKPMNISLAGTKMLVLSSEILEFCEDEPKAAFEDALNRLRDAGVKIEERSLPCVDHAFPLAGCLYTVEAYATWKTEIDASPDLMFPDIRKRFLGGKNFTGVEYVQSWQRLDALRTEYLSETQDYDAVLLPTSPMLPPNAERLLTDTEYYGRANLLALRNTRVGNLMGLCSLTLPTNTAGCGLMMMGAPHTETFLLEIGQATDAILRQ